MMKKLYTIVCLSIFLFTGCGDKEDNRLKPSYEDIDWFVIKDDPNNALQHLAYQIYDHTKVAIFWNDTIGQQERTDNYGKTYLHHEVLNIAYTVFNDETNIMYGLSKNPTHLTSGLEFLKTYVIPRLLKHTHPKCYLLTDTITRKLKEFEERVSFNTYKAMRTTLVACRDMDVMTKEQKEKIAAEVVATEYASFLTKQWDSRLSEFYELALYMDGDKQNSRYEMKIFLKDEFIPWEQYGFLNYDEMQGYEKDVAYTCPSKIQDVCDYIVEILKGKEVEFMETHKDYELCRKKYSLMKKIVGEMQAALKK